MSGLIDIFLLSAEQGVQIVGMDVRALTDILGGFTDGKAVFDYRLAFFDVAQGHLMAHGDSVQQGDLAAAIGNGAALFQGLQSHSHQVFLCDANQFVHGRSSILQAGTISGQSAFLADQGEVLGHSGFKA